MILRDQTNHDELDNEAISDANFIFYLLSLDWQCFLRTVPTFVTAHTFCALDMFGFPMGGAY